MILFLKMFLPCLKVLHKLNSKTFAFLHTRLNCCTAPWLSQFFEGQFLISTHFLQKNTMYVKIDIWIKNYNQIPTFLLIDVVLESAKSTNQDGRTKNLTHPCCFFSFCQFPISSLCRDIGICRHMNLVQTHKCTFSKQSCVN